MVRRAFLSSAAGLLLATSLAHAQTLSGEALISALRRGGYVIVMRHASSPREAPDQQTANADNVNRERQLDEAGRSSAKAMGTALKRLNIPIGQVFTSPTYRAVETVRLLGLQTPQKVAELGDGGQSMHGVTEAQSEWLQERVKKPQTRTNLLIVTHAPNMTRAFPRWTAGLADGESLIFGADG
jgi:phosphohistidine phosphatase SixA